MKREIRNFDLLLIGHVDGGLKPGQRDDLREGQPASPGIEMQRVWCANPTLAKQNHAEPQRAQQVRKGSRVPH